MLPHAAYFRALTTLGNTQTPEWHATVAGLVTLRLVDDWLDSGPYNQERHQEDLRAVRSLIANVPHAYLLQSLLERIVLAVEQAEQVTTEVIATPMFAYAESLECSGKFVLANDVLLPLRMQAERRHDIQTAIRTSLRLGFNLHTLSQSDLAIDSYHRAIHYAIKIGDTQSTLRGIMAEAQVIVTLGDWNRGYEIVADVLRRAEELAAGKLRRDALHELAHFASMRNDYQTAIPLYYRAMEYSAYEARNDERVVADLAGTLFITENIETSRNLNLKLALTAQQQSVRWQATICLMAISAFERQAENFELYRSSLQLAPLTPWLTVAYRRYVAEGYRIFGNEFKAQEERRKGWEVAEQHGIHSSYTG